MRDALMRLLEPPIEALGYELVDIEYAREGRGGVLRVFIDRRAAELDGRPPASVTVDDCARVSHVVSELLESEDPIKGHYTLEISSPGFDRILRKRAHFERFVGSRVHVELAAPRAGRRRYTGKLVSVEDEGVALEVDQERVTGACAEHGELVHQSAGHRGRPHLRVERELRAREERRVVVRPERQGEGDRQRGARRQS